MSDKLTDAHRDHGAATRMPDPSYSPIIYTSERAKCQKWQWQVGVVKGQGPAKFATRSSIPCRLSFVLEGYIPCTFEVSFLETGACTLLHIKARSFVFAQNNYDYRQPNAISPSFWWREIRNHKFIIVGFWARTKSLDKFVYLLNFEHLQKEMNAPYTKSFTNSMRFWLGKEW